MKINLSNLTTHISTVVRHEILDNSAVYNIIATKSCLAERFHNLDPLSPDCDAKVRELTNPRAQILLN